MAPVSYAAHLPVYLLGKEGPTWKLAVDVDADRLKEFLSAKYPQAQDLRALMPVLPVAELAIAGHATALSQWHKVISSLLLDAFSNHAA